MREARKPPAESLSGVVNWAAGPPHISIDSNGSLTQKVEGSTTWTYEWNAENQLKRVLKNGTEEATFKYDATGRRVERVTSTATTRFTYDYASILREQSGSVTWLSIHGPWIDEPLMVESGGVGTFLHVDGLGSVVASTNTAGAVVDVWRYGPWGEPESARPGYSFTGREFDTGLGLYYYRARYYDPQLGRFISEDPIRWLGGINLYAYVENDPTNYRDPWGLKKPSKGSASPRNPRAQTHQGLQQCRAASDFTGWEYCGVTCRKPDGSYYSTWPETDEDGGRCQVRQCEPNETLVETWHTHTDPPGGGLHPDDRNAVRNMNPPIPICAGLAEGGVECYNPNTNRQTCTGCPSGWKQQ